MYARNIVFFLCVFKKVIQDLDTKRPSIQFVDQLLTFIKKAQTNEKQWLCETWSNQEEWEKEELKQ